MELLLEGYRSDLQEIQLVTRSMRAQIDDTKEFINTHLVCIDRVRLNTSHKTLKVVTFTLYLYGLFIVSLLLTSHGTMAYISMNVVRTGTLG